MQTVAGIEIPDSALARDAETLVADTSPEFLLNHSRRAHVFAALAGQATGVVFDQELLYLATILHDLGLTDRFATEERLEVSGARAAASFCADHGLPADQVDRVWDAVALHASVGIADAKGGEVALTHYGVLIDVIGLGAHLLPDGALAAVVDAYPRHGFKKEFHQLALDQAARNPMAYLATWFQDSVRAHLMPLPTFEEALSAAPFDE